MGLWHLTSFYGNPDTAKGPNSWAKLRHLKGTSSLPWLAIGDFNELTGLSKKEGGSMRKRMQMEIFVNTINHCGFRDMGFISPKFTWLYQHSDGVQIRERLGRALATQDWLELFPKEKLYHLSSSVSDHSPLALQLA